MEKEKCRPSPQAVMTPRFREVWTRPGKSALMTSTPWGSVSSTWRSRLESSAE